MNTRVEKVRSQLAQMGLDAHLVTASDAIFYLTGKEIHPGERFLALVIGREALPTLYVPAMFQVGPVSFNVHYYQDHEKPLEVLISQLQGLGAKAIGVDKDWPARFLLQAMALWPEAKWLNGSPAVDKPRVSKDHEELECMRKASEINDQVMQEVYERLEQGNITELELSEFIQKRFVANGASGKSFETIVCFGEGSSEPHHGCEAVSLKDGPIIVDMGCIFQGYCSDMTRSFYKGEVPQAYKDAYQAVLDANEAAIAAVKPGLPLSEVDAAARRLLEARGYGPLFCHRTGHGIGISVHEYPDVSSVSEAICEVGMVFSIEPGVYLGGQYGIRIEDLVVVTETGCENLNRYPKALKTL